MKQIKIHYGLPSHSLRIMKTYMKKNTILFADDDPDILELVKYNLQKEGFQVHTAENGEKALSMMEEVQPQLVLLDVMMPKMDGVEACERIRKMELPIQPIIAFLTSRNEDFSEIAGFQAGGDDYINKPVRPKVLINRVKALLRRTSIKVEKVQGHQEISLDRERYLLLFKGEEVYLPRKEFELLYLLMNTEGKVYSRDQILQDVWEEDTIVGQRTVDVHIRRLREKIGKQYIRTVKGIGYTFKKQ